MKTIHVWAKWDQEAGYWYTAETSIRGLVTEGATFDELRDRLMLMIPDFLEEEMPEPARLHIVAVCDAELSRAAQ